MYSLKKATIAMQFNFELIFQNNCILPLGKTKAKVIGKYIIQWLQALIIQLASPR